jgi:hypothetical protein
MVLVARLRQQACDILLVDRILTARRFKEGRVDTTEIKRAVTLLERLGPDRCSVALRFMEFLLLDPVSRAVATAPPDAEPVTSEDRRRIKGDEARSSSLATSCDQQHNQ